MNQNFVDKVAFVHIRDRKVLVALNEGNDTWFLPGGHREPGETDEQTLIREVKEELSVDIVPDTIDYFDTFEGQAHASPRGRSPGSHATSPHSRESSLPARRSRRSTFSRTT